MAIMSTSDTTTPHDFLEPAAFSETIREFQERASAITESSSLLIETKEEDEQALESHEVVELQAFIDRKEWIEGKITLLESLPPIDVFPNEQDVNPIRTSATRAQLGEWLAEQDKIEKETEIFDSGDLKKLKKLTKAATQRNLSPEDTDLIEVTLSTLYALDKLFHLLRNRSEQLEQLGLRLSWEEHRSQALSSYLDILSDARIFLEERARWSSTIYASAPGMSSSDHKSEALLRGLSRSARFSLAETLSKDVAHISSRISALRLGLVNSSGKSLDKLLDDSQRSIPNWMLDEQDRIEEKCVKELASITKFIMNVVMQWKKSDEIYAETIKDCVALDDLLADLHRAHQEHPSRKIANVSNTRLDSLLRRISNRIDPLTSTTFPLPVHPEFPDQVQFNTELVELLSLRLKDARKLASKASDLLNQYVASCDAIDHAENLREKCRVSVENLRALGRKLLDGVDTHDTSGLPPNLENMACFEPLSSSLYLAMFPSLLDEICQGERSALSTAQEMRLVTIRLTKPGINGGYRGSFLADVDTLESSVVEVAKVREEATAKVSRLRDVRRIWSAMSSMDSDIGVLTSNLRVELEKHRWTQQIGGETMPPTPESLKPILVADDGCSKPFEEQIKCLQERFAEDVVLPLTDLEPWLPTSLRTLLHDRRLSLENVIREVKIMGKLLAAVRHQALIMDDIREEAHLIENQIEDVKISYDEYYLSMSPESLSNFSDVELADKGLALSKIVDDITERSNRFLESLHARVPFISQCQSSDADDSSLTNLRALCLSTFDATAIDNAVRNDSNAYAIQLSGAMKSLSRKCSYNEFFKLSREVSLRLIDVRTSLASLGTRFHECLTAQELNDEPARSNTQPTLRELNAEGLLQAELFQTTEALSPIEALIGRIHDFEAAEEDHAAAVLLTSQQVALSEAQMRLGHYRKELESYRLQVLNAHIKRQASSSEENALLDDSALRLPQGAKRDDPNDVFGPQYDSQPPSQSDSAEVLLKIRSLRKRLKSLGLSAIVNLGNSASSHSSTSTLPSLDIADKLLVSLGAIEVEANQLPLSSTDNNVDVDLRSLRLELQSSLEQFTRISQLSRLASSIAVCDTVFSDFLDYLDSQEGRSQSPTHGASLFLPAEDKLSERMAYTRGVFGDMTEQFHIVADDPRAVAEHDRLKQTWKELTEMALEKVNGRLSRKSSTSVLSSGRSSKASTRDDEKRNNYGGLSVSRRDGHLDTPSLQRRAASSAYPKQIREPSSISRLSVSKSRNTRSVSGPASPPMPSKSLFSSTFASRQRTTSVSSTASSGLSSIKSGTSAATMKRRMSSALSESPRVGSPAIQSNSRGSWSRAPRQSFSSFASMATPENNRRNKPRRYVANPENKLDVALGDVINNLPVDINVEAVVDTWKDKSGKYWIGGEEPKLCFCRILRSQTVMVRVGGGWQELSKFIKGHFADLFRIIPDSPERPSTKDRWISASTLRKGSDEISQSTRSPGTPDSLTPSLPSFALSTPDGTGSQAAQTPSPSGSPLTPLQFIRRADPDPVDLSLSPLALSTNLSKSNASSRPSISRTRGPTTNSQAKIVWRP